MVSQFPNDPAGRSVRTSTIHHNPGAVIGDIVFFTGTNGKETKVAYSFGYTRDASGMLKITLHHSSLPYAP